MKTAIDADKKQRKVNLDHDVHKAVKLRAIENDVSIQSIVNTGLRQYLKIEEPSNAS